MSHIYETQQSACKESDNKNNNINNDPTYHRNNFIDNNITGTNNSNSPLKMDHPNEMEHKGVSVIPRGAMESTCSSSYVSLVLDFIHRVLTALMERKCAYSHMHFERKRADINNNNNNNNNNSNNNDDNNNGNNNNNNNNNTTTTTHNNNKNDNSNNNNTNNRSQTSAHKNLDTHTNTHTNTINKNNHMNTNKNNNNIANENNANMKINAKDNKNNDNNNNNNKTKHNNKDNNHNNGIHDNNNNNNNNDNNDKNDNNNNVRELNKQCNLLVDVLSACVAMQCSDEYPISFPYFPMLWECLDLLCQLAPLVCVCVSVCVCVCVCGMCVCMYESVCMRVFPTFLFQNCFFLFIHFLTFCTEISLLFHNIWIWLGNDCSDMIILYMFILLTLTVFALCVCAVCVLCVCCVCAVCVLCFCCVTVFLSNFLIFVIRLHRPKHFVLCPTTINSVSTDFRLTIIMKYVCLCVCVYVCVCVRVSVVCVSACLSLCVCVCVGKQYQRIRHSHSNRRPTVLLSYLSYTEIIACALHCPSTVSPSVVVCDVRCV